MIYKEEEQVVTQAKSIGRMAKVYHLLQKQSPKWKKNPTGSSY